MRRSVHGVSIPAVSPAVFALALLAVATAPAYSEEAPAPPSPSVAEYDEVITKADREHWAFQPVRVPQVPDVRDGRWVRNPIDNFILARLEAKGWRPSDAAKPQALLRRVYLDIVGLPPTLQEQDEFLKFPTDAAFDKLADELLSRPGYGERWGRHWLDLVRYADSNGYERDGAKPSVWRYRDYVINSLNVDKPYDRFIPGTTSRPILPKTDLTSSTTW
jgi:hypothetical protein